MDGMNSDTGVFWGKKFSSVWRLEVGRAMSSVWADDRQMSNWSVWTIINPTQGGRSAEWTHLDSIHYVILDIFTQVLPINAPDLMVIVSLSL